MSNENADSAPEEKKTNGAAATEQTSGIEKSAEEIALEKAKEWENKYLYLFAEFDNFRKRMFKERGDFLKYGHEGFLRDLLQVQDNFERALHHARQSLEKETSPTLSKVIDGLEMVRSLFWDYLKNQGVEEIKSVGEKFNPSFHEAIGEETVANSEPNTIL